MKPLAFFCIADNKNLPYYEMMKKSLSKFHPDIPLILIGEEQIKKYNDPYFFYRATPIVAAQLLEEYECVVKIDADTIITGDLTHTWTGNFDVAVVNNANPKEAKTYPVGVWNIPPLAYVNCGYVVMKSKKFVEHWKQLCQSDHFSAYQFKEQDLLNIMVFYMNYIYDVLLLDVGPKWHGLISKQYTQFTKLVDGKIILPKSDEWPIDESKQIVCYHFAGGNNNPAKGNYRIVFPPDVVKFIDKLVKD